MVDHHTTSEERTTGSEPGPVPPPSARPPLRRSTDDRLLGGVAAGLGRHLGTDPNLVRLVLGASILLGGLGVALYLAGWLLIPPDDGSPAAAEGLLEASDLRGWLAVGLLVVGGLFLLSLLGGVLGHFHWRPLFLPLLLIGGGVLLWRTSDGPTTTTVRSDSAPPPPPPPTGGDPADDVTGTGTAAEAVSSAPTSSRTAPTVRIPTLPRPRRDRAPRERSYLGRLTLGVALLVAGVAATLDALGWVERLTLHTATALVLLVIGLGLVVGAWWGRARGLTLVGILLLPLLVLSGLLSSADGPWRSGSPLQAGIGDRWYAPIEAADLRPVYELGAGSLSIDLLELEPTQPAPSIDAAVGLGELMVVVPLGMTVEVEADVATGEIAVIGAPGDLESGTRLSRTFVIDGVGDDGTPDLRLDLRVGAGRIVINRIDTEEVGL